MTIGPSDMPHAGRGQPESCVLAYSASHVPTPGLLAKAGGLGGRTCDPGTVTEPVRPPAEKGSLGPESHWGSVAKEKNRAGSTLQDVSPSTRPGVGGGKWHPESREERPPSPRRDLGDLALRPLRGPDPGQRPCADSGPASGPQAPTTIRGEARIPQQQHAQVGEEPQGLRRGLAHGDTEGQ